MKELTEKNEHIRKADTSRGSLTAANDKKRVWEIDFIRGVAILGMVVDHFLWDLGNLNSFFYNFREINIEWVNQMGVALRTWYGGGRQYFHNLAFLFFLICGISSTFSRNNWKHSFKIFAASFVLFVGTYAIFHISYAINPAGALDFRIIFGVLYALAAGTFSVSLLSQICVWASAIKERIKAKIATNKGETYEKKVIKQAPDWFKWVYLALGSGLIIFWIVYTFCAIYPARNISISSFSDFWYWWIRKYDSAPYVYLSYPKDGANWFVNAFGLSFQDFMLCLVGFRSVGSDFFSLLPWVGWTLLGAFLGKTIYSKRRSLLPKLDGKWNKPFAYAGNKCLWIYVFHQVVLILIIAIVFCPMGYRFF